jgi:hypothetical protein
MMPTSFSLHAFTITESSVWMFFALIAALWTMATLILEYHWKHYAINEQKINSARFLYRAGSFFLLVIIFLTALSYSFS